MYPFETGNSVIERISHQLKSPSGQTTHVTLSNDVIQSATGNGRDSQSRGSPVSDDVGRLRECQSNGERPIRTFIDIPPSRSMTPEIKVEPPSDEEGNVRKRCNGERGCGGVCV